MHDIKSKLDQISEDVSEIKDRMSSIDKTLVKQQVILDEHIRRTSNLEERVEPLETHKKHFDGVMRFIGGLSVILGLIASVLKILKFM